MTDASRDSLRVLVLDIETRPSLAYVWSLWPESISPKQIVEAGEVIGVGLKWADSRGTDFVSTFHNGKDEMLRLVWEALNEADVVVTWNGKGFDIPWLQQEFLRAGMSPPAPFDQIDLYLVAKRRFRFASNKLDYVAKALGLAGKIENGGFDLWVKCMRDDPKAWELMARYCKRDVVLTGEIYKRWLAWIPSHPSRAVGVKGRVCPTCGGAKLVASGVRKTKTRLYQRFRCSSCGSWSQAARSEPGVVAAMTAVPL